jgi:hypothetical protein
MPWMQSTGLRALRGKLQAYVSSTSAWLQQWTLQQQVGDGGIVTNLSLASHCNADRLFAPC